MSHNDEEREYIRNFINQNCIARASSGRQLLSKQKNGYYSWQFYLRAALFNPRVLNYITEEFWQRFGQAFFNTPFQIAGVESASTPILTAIVLDFERRGLKMPCFSIRKERKEYGLLNYIEGKPTEDPVVFVDDVTSPNHFTFWHAFKVLRREGVPLSDHAFVLLRKQWIKDEPYITINDNAKIKVEGIFTLNDFNLSNPPIGHPITFNK